MCIKKIMEALGYGKPQEDDTDTTTNTGSTNTDSGSSDEGNRKKAFLWGINDYPDWMDADLNGCLNDVTNMYNLLVDVYKFPQDDVRVLTDSRATKQAILERLNWLVSDSRKGDELVFAFSSHGSQTRDRNDDELNDDLDEIIIPYDHDWDNPLLDDEIGDILKNLHAEANLTMIADCCHSGTIDRGSSDSEHVNKIKFITPPLDISMRSISRNLKRRTFGRDPRGTQRHTLLSGCKDNQSSMDAYINGQWQGALTWSLVSTLRSDPNQSYDQAYSTLFSKLVSNGFDQEPQLTCMDTGRPFFGGVQS